MALPNTHYGAEKIGALLSGRPRLFFDGIGGISMNALAHISHLQGFDVSGYDRTPSRAIFTTVTRSSIRWRWERTIPNTTMPSPTGSR